MYNIKPETFNFKSVKGISTKQLDEHYKLYVGYVNKLNEIWNTPYIQGNYLDSNATYSKMRSLKLGETYSLNGVKLHNLYFENMTNGNNTPHGLALDMITRQFSSYDNFISYLTNVGLSVRGWALLSIDSIDSKFHIIGSDLHDTGAVWLSYPILVMDVYEHAYFMDFGTDKKKYINTFIQNINWKVLNDRLQKYISFTKPICMNRNIACPMGFF
ncbi:superoxide dismutase, Fe-Mn family [Clostridium acidisoli DSM 12555]|uniref:superoxide dismutase n=1 Tax=Clostridium acidisoli DSM 12555 TaxID=1121291 RepID=A0A1W1XKV7_9CLOT|nr:superoxide dismutase [Clostridium acidisoli]SMC24620.1 superoxide dismutase, Fe-Mn family [Clostridium acidisoli DSM 12555]